MDGKRTSDADQMGTARQKKVCFVPGQEVLDYIEEGPQTKDSYSDADLDTVPTGPRRNRINSEVYSDEEVDDFLEDGLEDDLGEDGDEDKAIPPPKIDESSGEEESFEVTKEEEDVVRIIPFNLRAEKEEGVFDEGENYRINQDEDAYQDNWLYGITRTDMIKAKEAEDRRKNMMMMGSVSNQAELQLSEISVKLVGLLEVGETVTEALQRINAQLPPRRIGQKKKPSLSAAQEEEHRKLRGTIEEITSLATVLLDRGWLNVYDMTREYIARIK